MRKIKSLISVLLSLIIVSVFATSLVSSAASRRVLYPKLVAQEKGYYCGVASLQCVLWNENQLNRSRLYYDARGYKSQQDVVSLIKKYSGYDVDLEKETAWYTGGEEDSPSVLKLNPLCLALDSMTYYQWDFLGQCANNGSFTTYNVRKAIVNNIDKGHCVLANGESNGNDYKINLGYAGDREVLYPYTKGHWVVVQGYENNGNTIIIKDPAWHGVDCEGFNDISDVYRADINEFMEFINGSHGIVYCK